MSQVYHAEQDRKQNYEETETHQTGNTTHIKAHMFFKSITMLKLNLWQCGQIFKNRLCQLFQACIPALLFNKFLQPECSQINKPIG